MPTGDRSPARTCPGPVAGTGVGGRIRKQDVLDAAAKPAEETPLTALRVAELAMEAGVPPGVLNVVPGGGPEVGEPLGRHMDVDALSFTGSSNCMTMGMPTPTVVSRSGKIVG